MFRWFSLQDFQSSHVQKCIQSDMQRYRSGHNGADSKSVCEQSHEGSNPSRCAKKSSKHAGLLDFSFLPFRGSPSKIMERTDGFWAFSLYSNPFSQPTLLLSAISAHLLPKSTVSGSGIPLSPKSLDIHRTAQHRQGTMTMPVLFFPLCDLAAYKHLLVRICFTFQKDTDGLTLRLTVLDDEFRPSRLPVPKRQHAVGVVDDL
jgi:hypothetical protein